MSDEHVWTYSYENDGNGFFCEWWNIIRDGDKIGTVTTSEEDAKMICTMLNAAEVLSGEDARLSEGDIQHIWPTYLFPNIESVKKRMENLIAYADIREGKKA